MKFNLPVIIVTDLTHISDLQKLLPGQVRTLRSVHTLEVNAQTLCDGEYPGFSFSFGWSAE